MPVRCPYCREILPAEAPHRPFCSERCKLMDLGKWLDGGYRVASGPDDDEDGFPDTVPESSDVN